MPGRLGLLAACLVLAAGGVAGDEDGTGADRCAVLIALFDRVVQSQFDHRVLQIEAWELAEARAWRDQAAAECASGRDRLGIATIEAALRQVGVVPPAPAGAPSPGPD